MKALGAYCIFIYPGLIFMVYPPQSFHVFVWLEQGITSMQLSRSYTASKFLTTLFTVPCNVKILLILGP